MSLPQGVPHHIAIVMDGNGRWATKRFLPRLAGHKKGVDALRRCVRLCIERGVAVLTVFAFSSENWNRPQEEVSGLMDLMALALTREVPELARNEGEASKVAVRNLRRDANESVKKLVKEKEASEDDQKRTEADIQKLTDKFIAEIDALVSAKEQDIMAV